MAWTTPATWVANQLMTPALFNLHLRDNLNWLKTRPWSTATIASQAFSSASFAKASTTVSVTSVGGAMVLFFAGNHNHNTTSASACAVDFGIDDIRMGDVTNGLALFNTHATATNTTLFSLLYITEGSTIPIAGSHQYQVWARTPSGASLFIDGLFFVAELY